MLILQSSFYSRSLSCLLQNIHCDPFFHSSLSSTPSSPRCYQHLFVWKCNTILIFVNKIHIWCTLFSAFMNTNYSCMCIAYVHVKGACFLHSIFHILLKKKCCRNAWTNVCYNEREKITDSHSCELWKIRGARPVLNMDKFNHMLTKLVVCIIGLGKDTRNDKTKFNLLNTIDDEKCK